jgi:hypothetical protein
MGLSKLAKGQGLTLDHFSSQRWHSFVEDVGSRVISVTERDQVELRSGRVEAPAKGWLKSAVKVRRCRLTLSNPR